MDRIGILSAGLFSSGGDTLDETWWNIVDGQSSCVLLPYVFRGRVRSERAHVATSVERRPFRLVELASRAIVEALSQPFHIDALVLGSTSASFSEVEQGDDTVEPRYLVNSLADKLGIETRFQISQACSSSSHAIGLAADMIKCGEADIVLAGGADELSLSVMAAFESVRIHADRCMPFDARRCGTTLGEAAAFVLLARQGIGVPICFLDGAGFTCDASNSVAPEEDGIVRAIIEAVRNSGARRIDFVIAHGTGTKINDAVESMAIRRAIEILGMKLPITASYKGALGHPQGAAGAIGVVLGIQALRKQVMFPTVGFHEPDIEVGVEVMSLPVRAVMDTVLVLASGTWGTNSAIVLGAR